MADAGARTTCLGARLHVTPGLSVTVEGTRSAAAGQDFTPEYGLTLRGDIPC